ncbi:MAG: tetratricopeptide repeat protein [Bacteroidota bacterium]
MKKDYQDLIEKYLEGDLEGIELKNFEKKLENIPELKREITLQKEIREALLEKDVDEFRTKLQTFKKVGGIEKQKSNPSTLTISLLYKVAASVLLILSSALVVFLIFFNKPSNHELFNEYFIPYDNLVVSRGSSSENPQLNKAMSLYDIGKYRKAIEAFKNTKQENSVVASFYMGVSYLSIGDTENSINKFSEVIESDNEILAEVAMWYKALAMIKKEDVEAAKKILKQLTTSENSRFYRDRAESLLNELN